MEQSKWELKLHDGVEDPYYEITNGPISLCAPCGFVGETEEEEDAIFKHVFEALETSGIDFHSENKLELELYETNLGLQYQLDEWKERATELQAKCDKYEKALKDISESNCDHESIGYVKSVHSDECNACKATKTLKEALSGEGEKEVDNG